MHPARRCDLNSLENRINKSKQNMTCKVMIRIVSPEVNYLVRGQGSTCLSRIGELSSNVDAW